MSLAPGLISRRILFAVILAAALSAGGLPTTGRTPYYRDVGQNHLPNRALTAAMIRAGDLPLWNPHRGSGQPFMANPNSLVLRPTTPLFLLFPPDRAHVPFMLSLMLLAGIAATGTFLLLRETGRSDPAAAFGALAFVLSGAFRSLGQVVNLLEGAAWIPVTLWLLNRAFHRGWRPWAPLAGISTALVVTTGEPVLGAILLLGLLALPGVGEGNVAATGARGARRLAAPLAVAGLIAALVASIQILPLIELVSLSARGGEVARDEALKWSLPPAALVESFAPRLWGDPSRAAADAYWGSGLFETSLPFFPSIHLGLAVILLAAIGVAGRRRGGLRIAGVGLAGILLALGRHTPVHALLAGWIPGLAQSRYPVKWFLLASWCAALLAAEGFDRLLSRDGKDRRPASVRSHPAEIAVAASAVAAGLALLAGPAIAASALRALLSIPPRIADGVVAAGITPRVGGALALSGAATLILLFVARSGAFAEPRRAIIALAVAALPLYFATDHLNPRAPRSVVFGRSPLLATMAPPGGPPRRLFGYPRPRGFAYRQPTEAEAAAADLPADSLAWGMRWDTRTLRFNAPWLEGVSGAFDQGAGSLLGVEPGASVARRLRESIPIAERLNFLRAASAGWVLAYGPVDDGRLEAAGGLPGESNVPVILYRLPGAVARASVIGRAAMVGSEMEAVGAIGAGAADPALVVLLDRPQGGGASLPGGGDPREGGEGSAGSAVIEEDRPNLVRVRVRALRPGWLVLTDTWAPGWSASIGGEAAEIFRANGMFRAVRVGAGEQIVEFRYQPGSVRRGAIGSLLGLLAALLLAAGSRRRHKVMVE